MAREQVPVSVRMDADLHNRLKEQLDYGDSKSEWIRSAVEEKLDKVENSKEGDG